MLRKTHRFKTAEVGDDGTFSGYGSVFGVVDSYGDIVLPGAFSASLAAHAAAGTHPVGLWQHDEKHPILAWTEMREDDHGLFCRGRLILEVEKARETHALMKAGVLNGLSIGYMLTASAFATADDVVTKYGIDIDPDALPPGAQFRMIEDVDLVEVSVVTFPACAAARVETVKARSPASLDRLAAALAARRAALAGV